MKRVKNALIQKDIKKGPNIGAFLLTVNIYRYERHHQETIKRGNNFRYKGW